MSINRRLDATHFAYHIKLKPCGAFLPVGASIPLHFLEELLDVPQVVVLFVDVFKVFGINDYTYGSVLGWVFDLGVRWGFGVDADHFRCAYPF
jgi:hypothetical protein